MRSAILFSIMVLSFGCQKTENVYDDLNPDEQNYVRNLSTQNCKTENESAKSKYKETSDLIFSSSSYDRNLGFIHKYSEGTTEQKTVDYRVWKRDSNTGEIYFYVTEQAGGDKTYYFLRLTRTQNEEIIDDLFDDLCSTPAIFTGSTSSTGPFSSSYKYNVNTTSGYDEYTDSYSLSFSYPAIFARFFLKRTLISRDANGTQVGATRSFSSTFGGQTYSGNFDYTDYTKYVQKFCEVTANNGSSYRFVQTKAGFQLIPENCGSTVPADWNLNL